jgi:hypothetical protein
MAKKRQKVPHLGKKKTKFQAKQQNLTKTQKHKNPTAGTKYDNCGIRTHALSNQYNFIPSEPETGAITARPSCLLKTHSLFSKFPYLCNYE